MFGSDAMLQWEEEILRSTWHEFCDTFGRKLEAIGKLLRYTRPEATTAGPHNGADEISASTWKIHYTAHLIWSGIMLRGILHESVTATLQRTNQWEWAAGKKKTCLQKNPHTVWPVWGGYWSCQSGNQTYWTDFSPWWALTWSVSKPNKRQCCSALSTQVGSLESVLSWRLWWRTLPTVPFRDLKLADNEAWCTICVRILNCVSKGRISRTGHIGLSLANGLWMLLMHTRLLD